MEGDGDSWSWRQGAGEETEGWGWFAEDRAQEADAEDHGPA